LFWDSDCSETYLLDKNGKVHDLTDLTKEFYTILELTSHVDTAGWNPKSKEIQKRMERFVEYCSNNPEFLKKAITRINLSINPFHSLQTTALKQKQKGNIENYNKLHQKYLDMVANMINTFAPLIEHPKIGFTCRVYPDFMDYPELDGFRTKNMIELKTEIIEHFKSKYPETIEKYPKITDILENKIIPEDDFITKGGRDNQFKQFSRTWIKLRPLKELKSNEDLIKRAFLVGRAYIDLNGDFYMINDYESYKTNLRLNIGKDTNKPMRPPVHSQIVEI
ncbi:hypothetical protein IJ596_06490, partial [bacterium]|nr:hypothetical protein [bacterium]